MNYAYPLIGVLLLSGCASDSNSVTKVEQRETREPEAATGLQIKQQAMGHEYMIAAANPYASKAGRQMLAKGGSAIDAAIATQLVLTLVEPQSSGIGGGGFILYYDNKNNELVTFDGRETAPSEADHTLFLDQQGQPVPWIKAVVGGRSVGVPGILHAFKQAHDKYGKLPWHELFKPAIALADDGFVVSPRLTMLLEKRYNPGLEQLAPAKDYFYPNGEPLKTGTVKKNPKLAALYKQVAQQGIVAFYQGDNAKKLVDAVQTSEIAPGKLAESDLAQYQSKMREPICIDYHKHKVCSMAPPSSGGIAVLQILKLLEGQNLSQYQPNDPNSLHLFTQASRLAFADRNHYVADPDFVTVPTDALLQSDYLEQRAKLITEFDNHNVTVGDPTQGKLAYAIDDGYELPSTTHVSIVDQNGNAVSMTSSIEMAFGSTVMVNGYLLNNQLTDFSLSPKKDGLWVANRVEANKRPRSSMSPVMVFNPDGSLRLVVGSPGGSRIINYVAQTIIAVLDWQLTPQQAVNLPNITNRNQYTTLEKGTELEQFVTFFEEKGHNVQLRDLNSGLHVIEVKNGMLYGGADPRREGVALSEITQ
ncbi:gamma-glutamyltransferase [Pseudoalteromonas sp. T1lg23B]|uniref:gamma-glutamyltransferase n=1 Tax=Pseudoalteromonas sp. T1lg23B TaxID=2077097 RepID=UPI000CF5EE96|nr:gamma-glutamyltransferase [Pseudoalteromonas sp. T1lg23B]